MIFYLKILMILLKNLNDFVYVNTNSSFIVIVRIKMDIKLNYLFYWYNLNFCLKPRFTVCNNKNN